MIGIYKITNLVNGKSYIGQSIHIERRWKEHCLPSSDSAIAKAIQKYGKEQFSFQIVEECSKEELNEKEEYYISYYNTVIPNGYNIMDWVDGESVYYRIDKEILQNIYNDIQNSSLTFEEIGQKYKVSSRTITRINQGETYFQEEKAYPLRKTPDLRNKFCIDCGKAVASGAMRCKRCNDLNQRTVERPSREVLKQLIRTTPFTTLGKRYGVSDNAIRKWCKMYNLPFKSSEIKKISDFEWMKM